MTCVYRLCLPYCDIKVQHVLLSNAGSNKLSISKLRFELYVHWVLNKTIVHEAHTIADRK